MVAHLRPAVTVAALLIAAACGGGGSGPGAGPADRPVRFGFWGDTPYSGAEAQAVVSLVDQMNGADLDLAVFIGDIFGGPCENRDYTAARDVFARFEAPLVYVVGDNEWTDCHPTGRDPIERLSHVRRTMFASTRSFGREALDLDQQRPGYPENGRWRVGLVRFISLHVVGSNNNHIADPDVEEVGTPRGAADRRAAEDEYRLRDEANRRWLAEGFALAGRERAPVVVVAIHADPRFGVPPAERAARRADGFDAFLGALVPEVRAFGQPVVLIHGDSHRFVHDQPLLDWATGESVPNLTRIETFGSPDVGWVEVVVDPRQPDRPRVDAHLVGSFPN